MQNEMQHNGREGSRPEEAKTGASRAATPTEASTESGVMAAFSLLADPATIAGGLRAEAPGVGETKAKAEHETKAPGVVEAKAERETSAEPGLMDAASARRLAAEARARQRASREALAAAQRELTEQRAANGSPEPTLYADAEIAPAPSPSPADPSPSGWHQRPLATRPSARISVAGAEAAGGEAPGEGARRGPAPSAGPIRRRDASERA